MIESPEANPHTCGQLSTTKEARVYCRERKAISINVLGEIGQLTQMD